MSETLFSATTCPLKPRKFLFWRWLAETHIWAEICRWKTPLHYGTAFHTKKQCVACWEERIEVVEAYGP